MLGEGGTHDYPYSFAYYIKKPTIAFYSFAIVG